jgi:16S rRNA (cytosine967-C5)-methyltransferase
MHYDSYLRTCELILKSYDGKIPFTAWLKDFFRQDKKYGSRDRRTISHFCYVFFRTGNAFSSLDIKSRIINGIFLTIKEPSGLLEMFAPSLNNFANKPVEEKLEVLDAATEWKNIFPLISELSAEIDAKNFALSHLVQPDVYLRVRPGKEQRVKDKLTAAGIPFIPCSSTCFAVPNGSSVDTVLDLDVDVVVQDQNSQQVTGLLDAYLNDKTKVWDCCAASGGKSLALYDQGKKVQLTVSDIRRSILQNLERRFNKAGVNHYRSFVADIAAGTPVSDEKFDIIICDAPCSGSGTWGRTPEQLTFFNAGKENDYASLQKKIALNASALLKTGGVFLYITCSVFKKENEDVVSFLQDTTQLKLERMQYWKGYDKRSDTLFSALFTL